MRLEMVINGFPGKTAQGSLSWSSVVYLESGNRKILFDTGGPSKRRSIREHLRRFGVEATDIDMLILSHFHDDHVRNYDYFPNAEILLHEQEAAWADTSPVADFAFPLPYYKEVKQTGRLTLIRKDEEIVPGISTMLVPGHTPGGMAVVVRDPNRPITVLAGDAIKNLAELATGQVPGAHDEAASADSIRRVRDIAEIVVTGHDRVLQVTKTEIIALGEARETVIVPAGVGGDEALHLELLVGKTSRKRMD